MPTFRNARPDAVLFDHDGVLVASEALHWKAWGKLLGELGLPYQEDELRALVGKTAPEIMGRILDLHRPGWDPGSYDLNALALRKNDFFLRMAETELEPYAGVRELLLWLRAEGVKTAVVSNAKRRELESALRRLDLLELFDFVASRDDVQAPKPDPAPYLHAALTLETGIDACLAVEDSPTGIESALVGGIPSAAVLTNFPRSVMDAPVPGRPDLRPVWVGAGITDLHAWLRRLARPGS